MVDVPAKPRSTRQSTVASSSRARIARVRSSCGTRTTVVTRSSWPGTKQTVKPDFLCALTAPVEQCVRLRTMTTILITGASSGLGAEMARQFAARGHDLALAARRTDRLDALRAEIRSVHPDRRVETRAMDVTDEDSVFAAVEGFRTDFETLDGS